MNFMPPVSLGSVPTHSPSRASSKTTSLSVYSGLRESTGTQPVRHARSASRHRIFGFMAAIVDPRLHQTNRKHALTQACVGPVLEDGNLAKQPASSPTLPALYT